MTSPNEQLGVLPRHHPLAGTQVDLDAGRTIALSDDINTKIGVEARGQLELLGIEIRPGEDWRTAFERHLTELSPSPPPENLSGRTRLRQLISKVLRSLRIREDSWSPKS